VPTKTAPVPMFNSSIDIPKPAREELVPLLNRQLALLSDLHSQTKQAHWNVKGLNFYQLHKLFDDLAAAVEPFVDTIAERVTALGGTAMGTVRMAASSSELPEYPTEPMDGEEHLRRLTERYARAAASAREAIHTSEEQEDPTTADLMTEISGKLDESLYFLEAHLQK
jgi:starvation-inducible DNA-binding protein